jgi:hypothetical protein
MNTNSRLSRRRLIGRTAVAAAGLAAAGPPHASALTAPRFKIIGFSKPFAHLGPDATADLREGPPDR